MPPLKKALVFRYTNVRIMNPGESKMWEVTLYLLLNYLTSFCFRNILNILGDTLRILPLSPPSFLTQDPNTCLHFTQALVPSCSSIHPMFLEHWNRQKFFLSFDNVFPVYLRGLQKNAKKNHDVFFFKSTLSVLRCTWTGRINLKKILGYDINYLSICPFMGHP